jgi:hypothetical protein
LVFHSVDVPLQVVEVISEYCGEQSGNLGGNVAAQHPCTPETERSIFNETKEG